MLRKLGFGMVLVLLMALGIASCGDQSLQPVPSSSPEAVEISAPTPDATTTPEGLGDLIGGLVRVLLRLVKVVSDTVGGVLELGPHKLVVPAGALKTPTQTITLIDRGPMDGGVTCELLPHGLQFEREVSLSMSLKGTNVDPNATYTIYWYNENTGRWIDVKATWDPTTKTVTAKLMHFSRYRAGRAGW
jgi:hypothetical protein